MTLKHQQYPDSEKTEVPATCEKTNTAGTSGRGPCSLGVEKEQKNIRKVNGCRPLINSDTSAGRREKAKR